MTLILWKRTPRHRGWEVQRLRQATTWWRRTWRWQQGPSYLQCPGLPMRSGKKCFVPDSDVFQIDVRTSHRVRPLDLLGAVMWWDRFMKANIIDAPLFVIVMFYKVKANAEVTNTESLPWGKYSIWFPGAYGHNVSVDWSIYSLVLCVFLFKGILFNMYCWFSSVELVTNSTVTHAWMKLT